MPPARKKTGQSSKPSVNTTAIYVSGMPYTRYTEVKRILAAEPIGVQLRHIQNLSWIDKRILEILVDINHSEKMTNRITKYSQFDVKARFDPLSPESFNWDDDAVLPESKLKILQKRFVVRLAGSMASTRNATTREYIVDWMRNRGLGQQFGQQLQRDGIVLQTTSCSDKRNAVATANYTGTEAQSVSCRFEDDTWRMADQVPCGKRKWSSSSFDSFNR